jgi:hypothetical protein
MHVARLQHRDGLIGIARLNGIETRLLEHRGGVDRDQELVFDDEDGGTVLH